VAVRSTARIQAHCRGFLPNAATAGIQLVEAAESNIAQVFCERSLAGHCGGQTFWRALQDFGSYCFPHKL